MAKLYFKFGAMGSSKTANALMTVDNYEIKDHSVLLLKPSIETRDDEFDKDGNRIPMLKSRIGKKHIANVIEPNDNVIEYVENILNEQCLTAIVCDECQFFTCEQIDQLKYIAVYKDIPVFCFGLRTDYKTNLFPSTQRLFAIGDSFQELKAVCRCGGKAIVNARIDSNGNLVLEGEQVEIGGDDRYESMCWKCYNELLEKTKRTKEECVQEENADGEFTIVGYSSFFNLYTKLETNKLFSPAVEEAKKIYQSIKNGDFKDEKLEGNNPFDEVEVYIDWGSDTQRCVWASYDGRK